jgi:NAD+ kinase
MGGTGGGTGGGNGGAIAGGYSRLALLASTTDRAQEAADAIEAAGNWVPLEEADAVVVIGGDGFMLQTLHQMLDDGRVIPAYGINLGTVGFLMNKARSSRALIDRIARARAVAVAPLLRETRQTAKLEVSVNGKVRIAELSCDGVLVATPAGSTAYNLSANGPILPLGSKMLALTPISPFRPRRWRGAILPDHSQIAFRVLEAVKRPVAVVADQKELRNISEVRLQIARERELTLLFDPGHSLDERIVTEQFLV